MAPPYPFRCLLIPFDGSPAARQALQWAGHLAGAGGTEVESLTLLQVIGGGYLAQHIQNVDLRVTKMDQDPAWRRVRQHYLEAEVQPQLEATAQLLKDMAPGVPVATRVMEGRIGEEIIRVAREQGCTTVVMGRRGLSPVRELLLGSVTRQVTSLARNLTLFITGAETAWDLDRAGVRVLCPVDGSPESLAAVQQAAALVARCPGSCLDLLHVLDLALVDAALTAGTGPMVSEGEGILSQARQILAAAGIADRGAEQLVAGQPPRVIVETVQGGEYGLVLMGHRGRSAVQQLLLGSVANEVVHQASRTVVGIVYQ